MCGRLEKASPSHPHNIMAIGVFICPPVTKELHGPSSFTPRVLLFLFLMAISPCHLHMLLVGDDTAKTFHFLRLSQLQQLRLGIVLSFC